MVFTFHFFHFILILFIFFILSKTLLFFFLPMTWN